MTNKIKGRNRNITVVTALTFFILNYIAVPSLAAQNKKLDILHDTGRIGSDSDIVLKGQDLKKIFFQKVFSIELYFQNHIQEEFILEDISKAIRISSYRDIPRAKLMDLVNNWLDTNLDVGTRSLLRNEIDALSGLIIDLQKGDSFTIAYFPDHGTRFYLNEKLNGVIQGEQFAKILFSIWLGNNPVDENMKSNLMAFNK